MVMKFAWRNIFRQRRRSLFTALGMFGGFVLSSFFIAWSDGVYSHIINAFTRTQTGHIQIHQTGYLDRPSLYKTLDHPETLYPRLRRTDGVLAFAPRLYSAGLLSLGDKTAGIRIVGLDPISENVCSGFNGKIIRGAPLSPGGGNGAVLGEGLAKTLGAQPGDEVALVSQAADGSLANDLFRVTGVLDSGDEIGDRISCYLNLPAAQSLLVLENRIHEIAVIVDDPDNVRDINQRIARLLTGLDWKTETWMEFARSFYIAMKADQQGNWVMLLIIVAVVAAGVLNTVLMNVLERRREYGVLKAMGTQPDQIARMVLLEIGLLALACIACGALAALALNSFLSVHGISMPEPVTYGGMQFRYLCTEINFRSFYIPAASIFLSALLAGLFPALKAAGAEPARAMRTH